MKHWFVIVWIISAYHFVGNAQTIQLIMSPNPSPYISDWENRTETAMLIVTNLSGDEMEVKVKAEVFDGQGEKIANTIASKMPVLQISPGVSQFRAEDIFPLYAAEYHGSADQAVVQTGRIPDDHYQICVSLIDPQTHEPIGSSGVICKPFTIIDYQAPTLLTPIQNEVIQFQNLQSTIFRWTPIIPTLSTNVTYRLQVFEVLPGQENAFMAMASNQPIVEKDYRGLLQAAWPVEFPLPEVGRKYVWTVTPLDDQERKIVDGYGFAEPFEFEVTPTLRTGTVSTGTAGVGDLIKAGDNGEFEIEVTEINTNPDGTLTGKGKVVINWLLVPMAVEFVNITIDTDKNLLTGGITAVQGGSQGSNALDYPKSWLMSAGTVVGNNIIDGATIWTNNKINDLVNGYVNNTLGFSQPMMLYQSNITPPPIPDNLLKLPFGLQFPINNNDQKILITEIIFKPNESKLNFILSSQFDHSGTPYKLGFTGKYFIIHPSGVEFSNGRVDLAEDFTMPSISANPKMHFLFKKGTTNAGCYVQWSDNGLDHVSLEMEVEFSRDWLIPISSPSPTSKVKAIFSGNGSGMSDILLTGSLPNCEIVGTGGLKIQVSAIALDMSDVQNPLNISFPSNYPQTPDLTWEGFYLNSFQLILPESWKTGNNQQPPSIQASNLIIDDMGLTTQVLATNIFSLGSGNVADLSASLDTVKLSIVNSSLINGRAAGKIILPVSENLSSNTLKYKATFAQSGANQGFQFVILPEGEVNAEILRAKIIFSPTTNITASITPGLISTSLTLNGTFKWDNPNLMRSIGSAGSLGTLLQDGLKGVKMELTFENLTLTYSRNTVDDNNTLNFNFGHWSFASPQKQVNNMPVTIDNIDYKSLTTSNPIGGKQLVHGAIMFDIVVNLTEEIGGSTTIGAAFSIDFFKSPLKLKPNFEGVVIDKVEVHADLAAVKIYGLLELRNNDPVYGDGFLADIEVTFTAVSFKCHALAEFGTTAYLNPTNELYRYWRVEADVVLPVGIPFMTGLGFYGFGGGAFYNMEALSVPNNRGGFKYTFKPKKSSLGFQVKAIVGTMPSFDTFNADVSLLAQFSNSSGITYIGFIGNFWVAASLEKRPTAYINGGVSLSYNFPDKIFDLQASVSINIENEGVQVITTPSPVGLHLNINGRTNKWYFISGTPNNTNTVNIFGISLYSYLMFGNDIPFPNGFTQRFQNNYTAAVGYAPGNNVGNGGVGPNTATGKGFATGVGIEFSRNVSQVLYRGSCREWSIGGNINAGAELNLAMMHQIGCKGINGYRASGNLGLYANMNAGIYGNSFSNVCDNKSYNLFRINGGAWVQGKFPNPEYISGYISANINLFNGLCSCSFSKSFSKGSDCTGQETTYANAAQEDEADSLRNKLIQYVAPNTTYNYNKSATINVKYNLVLDELLDVPENQGDGTISNRVFMLKSEPKLEMQDGAGNWKEVQLYSEINSLGEHQYFIHDISSIITEATKVKELANNHIIQITNLLQSVISLNANASQTQLDIYFRRNYELLNSVREVANKNIDIAISNLDHNPGSSQTQSNKTLAESKILPLNAALVSQGRGDPNLSTLNNVLNLSLRLAQDNLIVASANLQLAMQISNSTGPVNILNTTVSQLSSTVGKNGALNTSSTQVGANGMPMSLHLPSVIKPSSIENFPSQIPQLENHLAPNTAYRFYVKATLMEMKTTWAPAVTRSGQVITETKDFNFNTGSPPPLTTSSKK